MPAFPLKLVVGLGNPGPEYARTRHNAGFWFVDALARKYGGTFRHEGKHQGDLARIRIGGEELWLLKPMTYMNKSGSSVRSLSPSISSTLARLWWGTMRSTCLSGPCGSRREEATGGHNGLRDLIGTYWRCLLAVALWRGPSGPPGRRDWPCARQGEPGRGPIADELVDLAVELMPELIEAGPQRVMHRLHTVARTTPGASPDATK